MPKSSYALFEQKVEGLRAYLSATSEMRRIAFTPPAYSEPSILDSDLAGVKEGAPDHVRWRVIEHTLTVGHLYALYESYCEELLRDWIGFLTQRFSFLDLPEKLVEGYKEGFARLSSMLPSPRHPMLTIDSIVENYHSALRGDETYNLDPECLTYHRNNLRWTDLCQLFARCGVDNLGDWVGSCAVTVNFFDGGPGHVVDQLSSKLTDLIQYRNDCSHGLADADEILGYEDLLDMIDLILALANALDQLIIWKKLEILLERGEAASAGKVSEVFRKAGAFICTSVEGRFEVGRTVYIKTGANMNIDEIISIRINDTDATVVDAVAGQEIGIKCEVIPRVNSHIYFLL